jgi:pimeloyl-ACP methyl ester carboxylesterase
MPLGARMPDPLLLIPGLMCTVELFAPQVEAFAAEREVLVADHTRADTMEKIASQILAEAPERFALAGLSMGVYLSLEIMAQAPERVSRLALLDGKARPDTPEQTAARQALLNMADEGRFIEITTDVLMQRLIAPHRLDNESLRETIIRMAADTGEAAFRRQMNAIMIRRDYRPVLEAVNCPTLVLTGELDVITPPDCAREMAAGIAGAELLIVPGCGHLATLEAPETVNGALARWLAREV